MVALVLGQVGTASANPVGGTVSSGKATISTPTSGTVQIDQTTKIVIINWNSFNIAGGETTKFVQPNASSIAVNRIGGNDPSTILGSLLANGKVVLINGNGILFGKGATVNVGSLLATTSDASDADIASGKAKFDKAGNPNAQIINQGNITAASGGMVGLVAPAVSNSGTITAKLGTVQLGASNVFTVDFTGDGLVSFPVDGNVVAAAIDKNGKPVEALVVNDGKISGGTVILTARAAANLVTNVISMKGEIVATSAHQSGGKIVLDGGQSGDVAVSGALNASGTSGGSISVVSQGATSISGTINAEGSQGNGGFVETSGQHLHVADSARVSTLSNGGAAGTWLIDPNDFTIAASGGDITGATLSTNLATSDVTIHSSDGATTGSGDIYVNDPVSWTSAHTLTLDAYHSIYIDAPITVGGASGGLTLTTNDGGTGGDYFFDLHSSGFAGSLSFTAGSGGSLSINGTSYTLLYSMADMQAINTNNTTLTGHYALANSLDATSTSGWVPIGTNGTGGVTGGTGPGPDFFPLGFSGTFEGLGHTISNLTVNQAIGGNVGPFGDSSGTIRDIGMVGGSVTGAGSSVGGLVGTNDGTVIYTYETGTVAASAIFADLGGLVGKNGDSGTVSFSFATGAVSGLFGNIAVGGLVGASFGTIDDSYATGAVTGGSSAYEIGGLVGNNTGSSISDSYASGAVIGGSGSTQVGGLVGWNLMGTITNTYASGAVSGGTDVGGLVGQNTSGTLSHTYWDTQTSGQGTGIGADDNSQSGNVTGKTTAQLQSGTLPTGFGGTVWSTDSGRYPYLQWQPPFPAVQVSGTVYSDYGVTALGNAHVVEAFLTGGAVIATGTSNASTGAYSVAAPGSNGTLILFLDNSSGKFADTVVDYSGTALTNVNLYAGHLNFINTSAVSVSSVLSSLSSFTAPTGGYSANDFLFGVSGSNVTLATGAGLAVSTTGAFTVDQALTFTGTNGLEVKTGAGDITISDPVSLANGTLMLDAYHSVLIDAPITISGSSGSAALTTNDGGAGGDYSFDLHGNGFAGSLSFTAGSGGSLSINGTPYTLLYSMADMQAINANNTALQGHYALANSRDATSTSGWVPIGTDSAGLVLGSTAEGFTGAFTGLGHTISNLTVNIGSNDYAGLFGSLGGTLRDIGMAGGSFQGNVYVGGLVGYNDTGGAISNAYTTGAVTGGAGSTYVGGLVGVNIGAITNAFATGAVSGFIEVGGLVGEEYNTGTISNAFAAGAVSGQSWVGGLVGENNGGLITNANATGAVSGTSRVGGLVGVNDTGGTISNAYAMGAVRDGEGGDLLGGLVGINSGAISNAYSTGTVSDWGGGSAVGGLVGQNSGGTLSHTYWNKQTSGELTIGIGTDNNSQSGHITGKTTAQLQGTLPTGFSGTVWGTGSGLYPYLIWQYDGTPQAISGIAYSDAGTTPLGSSGSGAIIVSALVNGVNLATVTTGANGYYYILSAPGTLTGTQQVLTYLNGDTAKANTYTQSAGGTVSNANLYGGYLRILSSASTTSAMFTGLSTAMGGNTGGNFLYSGSSLVSGTSLDIESSNGGGLSINGAINVGTGTVIVNGAGALGQTGGGIVTAATLKGSSAGSTMLTAANKIGSLGAFTSSGAFSLTDAQSLTVSGALNVAGGNASLATTGSGHNLTVNAAVSDSGHTLSLTSAGTIGQASAGVLTAATLTGSSAGSTTLTAANQIGSLGAFTSSGSFSLTDAQSLTVGGVLNVTGGNASLATTGSGHNLTVNAAVSDSGHTLSLTSAGTIGQASAGVLTAATFTGSSDGNTTLNSANLIGSVGAFTSSGGFQLTDAQSLTVNGALNATGCCVVLQTTGSGSNMMIDAAITNTAHTLQLYSGGTISENSAGVLTAAVLTGSSHGATTLNGANMVTNLGAFTTGGNFAFALTDAQDLTVQDAVNAGTAGLTLTTTGTGSGLIVDNTLSGGTVTLVSAATILSHSPGIINATTLTGSSHGATTLIAASTIANLGAFTTGGNNAFILTDAHSLNVNGAVNAGTAGVTLATTGGTNAMTLAASLTGGTVTLNSAGTITQTAGIINATTLMGSSHGATTLTAANTIANLGAFTTGGNNAFNLTDAHSLNVNGAVNAGTAGVTLATTGGTNAMTLAASLTGGTVTLNSAGTITQTAGVINATTLTGSSHGATTLNDANIVTNLGAFTNAGTGGFAFTDAKALIVSGTVNGGTGTVALTTTGATTNNLTINATVETSGAAGVVTFISAGNVAESTSTGAVITHLLNVTAKTGILLTSLLNNITVLGTNTTASGGKNIHL